MAQQSSSRKFLTWRNFFFLIVGLVPAGVALAASTGILYPSGDGTYTAFTAFPVATHYVNVDESICNESDFNYTFNVGDRDSYLIDLSSIPNGSTITDIEISPCASQHSYEGVATTTMNVFYRWNANQSADAGNYQLTNFVPVRLASTTFSGLSLAKDATFSSFEIGTVYTASGTYNHGIKLSDMRVKVTYN